MEEKIVPHGTKMNITILLEKGNEIILNCCKNEIILNCCKINGTSVFIPTLRGWCIYMFISHCEL